MTSLEHKQELDTIKMWLHQGAVSYDKAKEMAQPHLDAMNEKGKEIAKKYKRRYCPISFTSFMR